MVITKIMVNPVLCQEIKFFKAIARNPNVSLAHLHVKFPAYSRRLKRSKFLLYPSWPQPVPPAQTFWGDRRL